MKSATPPNGERRIVKTACGMCIMECGINVSVEKEKIVDVKGMPEHPVSRGKMCVKGTQIQDYVYSNDRLKYPMQKQKGEWQRISWEEAIDTIATKLIEDKQKYGRTSFGIFAGDPVAMALRVGWDLIWRFCDVYGTPNRFYDGDLCGMNRIRSGYVTLGKWCVSDLEGSKCIILWGGNPKSSSPTVIAPRIVEARRKGCKLIVIDPRRTPFAKQADIHVQIRPGTDAALALAMLNIIISEDLYDKEFVKKFTIGFDRLIEHIKKYPPEWAERVTGIASEDIRKIARIFATTKPASIRESNRLGMCASGFHHARAVAILMAITGNIDVAGGWIRAVSVIRERSNRLFANMGEMKLIGADERPLAHQVSDKLFGHASQTNWAGLVLTGKPYALKNLIVSGSNPVVTWPNAARTMEALQKLDFLVVMDVFMTPTAEMADIVLPACTFAEKINLCRNSAKGVPSCMLRRQIIQPLWESWSDCKFWLALAKRMGYEEFFPWKDDEEVLDYFLEPSKLTVRYLRDEHPTGIISVPKPIGEYKEKGFQTPSGKVEIYSEELKRLGYDPLPTYVEPVEGSANTPELVKQYPLTLISGTRELEFWHSQHRNLPKLRRINSEPVAEINSDTAMKGGIKDADLIIVETKRGSIEIKARVTPDIMPDVVSIGHGWLQANVNMLTDDMPGDQITGLPTFSGLLCRVRKKP